MLREKANVELEDASFDITVVQWAIPRSEVWRGVSRSVRNC